MRRYFDCEIDEYWDDNEEDIARYERKFNAALYIRAHFKKLMKDEAYKAAYYMIIDELAREFSYKMLDKIITVVSDEERELQSVTLDFEISLRSKKEIEKYKEDAEYVLNWVRE